MKGNFNNLINGEKPVLVDFHAEWCGPCKALSPIIKQVASELQGQLRIVKIDVDKNQKIAQLYSVKGVPTLMLFKKGQVIWRESGLHSKQHIIDATTKLI